MIGKRLKKGDTIGLISPASIESIENINKGKIVLENLGFNIAEGKHIYDKWGYFAGRDKDRAEDIMKMFLDDSIDMILCVRGGYGSMRILPYIDFNLIKRHPKIIMGYSDITVLLNAINERCNLITFHGPTLSSDLQEQMTLESLLNTLIDGDKPYSIMNPSSIVLECYGKENVEGELVGGNLCLITSNLGTPYEIDTRNKILFLEEVGEEPYRIDRMLTQLLLAGKLQQCKGIILGQFTDCETNGEKENNFTLWQVIENRILSLNKPVMVNLMSGHSYPKLTLPIGAKVELNYRQGSVEVLEPVVK
jgi:muramoyltetrapeptide carboxypeptidase